MTGELKSGDLHQRRTLFASLSCNPVARGTKGWGGQRCPAGWVLRGALEWCGLAVIEWCLTGAARRERERQLPWAEAYKAIPPGHANPQAEHTHTGGDHLSRDPTPPPQWDHPPRPTVDCELALRHTVTDAVGESAVAMSGGGLQTSRSGIAITQLLVGAGSLR